MQECCLTTWTGRPQVSAVMHEMQLLIHRCRVCCCGSSLRHLSSGCQCCMYLWQSCLFLLHLQASHFRLASIVYNTQLNRDQATISCFSFLLMLSCRHAQNASELRNAECMRGCVFHAASETQHEAQTISCQPCHSAATTIKAQCPRSSMHSEKPILTLPETPPHCTWHPWPPAWGISMGAVWVHPYLSPPTCPTHHQWSPISSASCSGYLPISLSYMTAPN